MMFLNVFICLHPPYLFICLQSKGLLSEKINHFHDLNAVENPDMGSSAYKGRDIIDFDFVDGLKSNNEWLKFFSNVFEESFVHFGLFGFEEKVLVLH
jgi:hypothetical protein